MTILETSFIRIGAFIQFCSDSFSFFALAVFFFFHGSDRDGRQDFGDRFQSLLWCQAVLVGFDHLENIALFILPFLQDFRLARL